MDILKKVYENILQKMPVNPPEIGGILGSIDGIVCNYLIDTGNSIDCGCFYSPDINFLNGVIKHWQTKGVRFCGIFHKNGAFRY